VIKALVSVLMTAYNRERYITEAIESVLASKFENWELIIVDDGSKDGTVAIAKSYAAKDARIKVHVNEKNLGDYPNRNRAVSYASGEYIMFCDSDDTLFPDSINKILSIIAGIPEFNFAMYWPHSPDTFTLKSEAALRKHFFNQQFLFIGPGGTFMTRSFMNSIGGYPEKYGPANDMYFNLKVACTSPILLFPFKLVYYRRHDGQQLNDRFSYMYNNYLYMRDALHNLQLLFTKREIAWLKKKNKRRFTVHLFNFLRRTKDIKKTKEAFRKAEFSIKYIFQGIFQI
jgi:glycosyltransferase involved in cell wall biosynthesis